MLFPNISGKVAMPPMRKPLRLPSGSPVGCNAETPPDHRGFFGRKHLPVDGDIRYAVHREEFGLAITIAHC